MQIVFQRTHTHQNNHMGRVLRYVSTNIVISYQMTCKYYNKKKKKEKTKRMKRKKETKLKQKQKIQKGMKCTQSR